MVNERPALSRYLDEQAIPGKVQARVHDLAVDKKFRIEAVYSLHDAHTDD